MLAERLPPCNLLYSTFTHVPLSSASGITQVCCGNDFSVALSASGNVYTTGCGANGIHGMGQDDLASRYRFAPVGASISAPDDGGFFKTRQIRYVSAGENHCGAIDSNGTAFMWGQNTSGQCGVTKGGAAKSSIVKN